MPDFGDVEFLQMLKERKIRLDGLVMEQYFNGLFHKKLAGALLKRIGISGTMPVHDLSEENLERLCRICKHFRTYIDKTNPFEQAQICAGGVDTSEIDPDTMESKLVKRTLFCRRNSGCRWNLRRLQSAVGMDQWLSGRERSGKCLESVS